MATSKPKESFGLGKEKKITTPSSLSIPTTPTKRTPKSSPRGTSTDHKPFSSSSDSSSAPSLTTTRAEKHVPNYLKSTASSRHDHTSFKPIKKPAGGPAPIPEGKPSLNRRRSFDKPPPTAPRLDKPFRSPGPRDRAAHVPVRSSSFGAKPSTTIISSASAKPSFLERSASKISKVGGKPQQVVPNLRSSSNVKKSLKRNSSNVSSASADTVPKTKNGVEHVDQSPQFVLGVNDEELKKIECELDRYLPDPIPEFDKELSTTDQVEKDEAEIKKLPHHQPIQDTEIFKVDVSKKEVKEETAETEISPSLIREEENRERNEEKGGVKEEEEAKDEKKPDRVIAVEKEEVVASDQESTNNKNEEKSESETDPVREEVVVLDEKEAQDGQSCKEENNNSTFTTEKEAESTEKVVAAAEAEKDVEPVAAISGKPRQGGPGRKESPAMYNDVIEETASKLLEKRKNKVRALAGAFQTVIDYESSSK